jgi:hypothetical protein
VPEGKPFDSGAAYQRPVHELLTHNNNSKSCCSELDPAAGLAPGEVPSMLAASRSDEYGLEGSYGDYGYGSYGYGGYGGY